MFAPSIPYPGSRRSLFRILSKAEQRALIQLAQHFLQQKRLIARQDFVLDDLKSARLALLFCLPVLNLGYEWLDGFHDVLIYPAPLMVDDEWQDAFSLTHHQRTALAGQRWQ